MLYEFLQSNHIQFSFQLLISELAFLADKPRRRGFGVRAAAGMAVHLALADIWEKLIGGITGESLFPYVPLYFGYAVLTAALIYFCFEIQGMEVIFVVTSGYAAEHMCFALSRMFLWIFHLPYDLYGDLLHLVITRYLIYLITAAAVYYFVARKNKGVSRFRNSDKRMVVLSFVLLFAAVGLSVYWSYPPEYLLTGVGGLICPAYSFLCSAMVLLMEYYVLRENSMKREKEMMEQLMAVSDAQQKSAKEAIDIINMKCHDLKHQIRILARMEDSKARSEYLQEVQEAVSIYDAVYHTGSKALDYVLREKTLLFHEYQIEFSCMVEEEIIPFMKQADVYALMGNALDNALERVLKEKEEERIVSLHIKSCGEMLLLHLENRCSGDVQFQDGLPLTDKEDKGRHGFGVRSIRYIAEKYQGELFMRVNNGRFFLDILFPKIQQKDNVL